MSTLLMLIGFIGFLGGPVYAACWFLPDVRAKHPKAWLHGLLTVPASFVIMGVGATMSDSADRQAFVDDAKKPPTQTEVNEPVKPAAAPPKPVKTPDPFMKVTASQLIKEYKANKISAEDKYDGKQVAVTGYVDSIGDDILGTLYVTLNSGDEYEFLSVQCMFSDNYRKKLSALKKGQKVIVKGTISGYTMNVLVNDSTI